MSYLHNKKMKHGKKIEKQRHVIFIEGHKFTPFAAILQNYTLSYS